MSYLRPTLPLRTHPTQSTSALLPFARPQTIRSNFGTAAVPDAVWPHPVHTSSRLTDRKSIFLAHASVLSQPAALPQFIEHLHTIPRLNTKRATHCMYAYRAAGVAGQSDGGEGGSGDRLERLLRLNGCEDVVVVVWRWYGGVKLGADRWKRISGAAREALDAGGFLVKREAGQSRKGKKKR